jgi:Glu-tRNA(Gln) amidotransferase subunit E-like FAD-binding protein
MAVIYALATESAMKAGANVSSVGVGATYLEAFGEMAESVINVESGYNWSDWYTAYGATYPDVSQILVDAATNLTAIYIINYDMSGFTNIQEAVSRINTLYQMYQNDLRILKEEGKKDFLRLGGGVYP